MRRWILERLCTTREQYLQRLANDPGSLIVLKAFANANIVTSTVRAAQDVTVTPPVALGFNAADVSSLEAGTFTFGFVFTSPKFLENIVLALSGKRLGLNLSTDGTYRISEDGWP